MTRIVTGLGEAKAVLDYFNGFHDGFIKQLSIISHDSFEERHVQSASQRLDLQLPSPITTINGTTGRPIN